MTRRNTSADFWARVDKRGPDECWPWTGRVKPPTKSFPQGHGMYDHDGTWDYAHRYAYFLTYGDWPQPIGRHTCDNPVCCNPNHIIPGTLADNVADRTARGRKVNPARGERHGSARLSQIDVDYIRANYVKRSRDGKHSLRGLAERYEVSITTVHRIVTGKNWT